MDTQATTLLVGRGRAKSLTQLMRKKHGGSVAPMDSSASIFITYSHQDEAWKDFVVRHLDVASRQGVFDLWYDRKIGTGEDWQGLIEAELARARVAVLLVSSFSLTSDFILRNEVETMLRRRERGGLSIVPIVVSDCAWQLVDWLVSMNLRPKDGKALDSFTTSEQNRIMTAIVLEIAAIARSETSVVSKNTVNLERRPRLSFCESHTAVKVSARDSRNPIVEAEDESLARFMPDRVVVFVERLFSEVRADGQIRPPSPLIEFADRSTIVIIGDPGMGKTTSLKACAKDDPNALFKTVRSFLNTPLDRLSGKTLYIDALDEHRARTQDGTSVLDQVIQKIGQLESPAVRLTCRAADWESGSDREALADASADKSVVVLHMEPLTDQDIERLVDARGQTPADFVGEAERRGLATLLSNPQTLNMLLDVVIDGGWPKSLADLYERTVELLLREENQEHLRVAEQMEVGARDLERAAGYLCAVQLLADVQGIAITAVEADDDFPALQGLASSSELPRYQHLRVVAQRRLFEAAGPERITPPHRTITEYLAARFLAGRIDEGLPPNRVIVLMTGHDGGILSALRGLYAWLVCFCTNHSDQLISIDPIAAVIYGDASLWSASTKRRTLREFERLSETDPYFRTGAWGQAPLGNLSDVALMADMRRILSDSSNFHLVRTVLDILEHGDLLPDIGDELINLTRNAGRDEQLRGDSIRAFAKACPNRRDELFVLLEDVHRGNVPDEQKLLRAALFEVLYPDVLRPADIVPYMVDSNRETYSSYGWFIAHRLPKRTPTDWLPELADALADRGAPNDSLARLTWSRLVQDLLQRIFDELQLDVPSLYRWLGMGVSADDSQLLEQEATSLIRDYIAATPQLYRDVFDHWFDQTTLEDILLEWVHFQERLCRPELPSNFGTWLAEKAGNQRNPDRRVALFRLACQVIFWEQSADDHALRSLFDAAVHDSDLAELLEQQRFIEVPEWRIRQARQRRERHQEREEQRSQNVDALADQLEAIARGEALGPLVHFADVWFGRRRGSEKDTSPRQRIVDCADEPTAEALCEGFVALLHRNDLCSPTEIGELNCQSRRLNIGFALIAGLDIQAERSKDEFLALPEATLASGLSTHLVTPLNDKPVWIEWLFMHRPDLVRKALLEFWRPFLASNRNIIPGIYELGEADEHPVLGTDIIVIFGEFRQLSDEVRYQLLRAALRHCPPGVIESAAMEQLSHEPDCLSNEARLDWRAIAFLINSNQHADALMELVRSTMDGPTQLYLFLRAVWGWDDVGPSEIDSRRHATLISILGRAFDNVDREGHGGFISATDPPEIARHIRSLIDRLGATLNDDANEALRQMLDDTCLASWHDHLKHTLSVQTRGRREANFRYVALQDVIGTIANQAPADTADLQALVVSHLRDLVQDFRAGATDGWKNFWNTDGHGNPVEPRSENDSRDRLIERLKVKLPQNVIVDREGSLAENRRCDIKVVFSDLLLPIEIKRHYHREVWTAIGNQLRQYSRHPAAAGRGVYIVFWYGTQDHHVPVRPCGAARPASASEMEQMLTESVPSEDRHLLHVVVLDCSPPNRVSRS